MVRRLTSKASLEREADLVGIKPTSFSLGEMLCLLPML